MLIMLLQNHVHSQVTSVHSLRVEEINTVEVKPMNSRLYGGLGTAAQGRTLDGETGEFIGFTSTVSHLKSSMTPNISILVK